MAPVSMNEILVSHKKDETLPFPITHLDFQGIMLSEIIWKERHTGISGPCACASSTHRSHGTHSSRHWGHLPGPRMGQSVQHCTSFNKLGNFAKTAGQEAGMRIQEALDRGATLPAFRPQWQIVMNIPLISRQDPGKEEGNLSRPT